MSMKIFIILLAPKKDKILHIIRCFTDYKRTTENLIISLFFVGGMFYLYYI